MDFDWQLPALAELHLEGVRQIYATTAAAHGFSSLQQLTRLVIYSSDNSQGQPKGALQSAIARLLRVSPRALRSLVLDQNVLTEKADMAMQFAPDLVTALGGLTQLQQLRFEDLWAGWQSRQQELRQIIKEWYMRRIWELARLRALRSLPRYEAYRMPARYPLSADLKNGVEQVLCAWGLARLGQGGAW